MRLSTKGKYSLYAMLYLAEHADHGPQPLRSMAGLGVQEDYLEQLLAKLRRAGLVHASRGASGGYQLSRAPGEISVGDVIRATEGPVRMAECPDGHRACHGGTPCPTRQMWDYLSGRINDLMDSITLADMLRQNLADPDGAPAPLTSSIKEQEQ